MIEVKALSKTYTISGQRLHAADGINFTIKKGEIVSIVGHSGSGKTTLLSLLGGLTKPDGGQVLVDGVDLWSLTDDQRSEFRNRRFSFIYQFSSLIPTLTALENVLLPTAFGEFSGDLEGYALELLAKVGLGNKGNFYPSQLSGGQQRRVAIARAFINHPEVVLADEPTGDLDEETEQEIISLFKTINVEQAVTFIIVTHNNEIANQSQRKLRMKDGVLSEKSGAN